MTIIYNPSRPSEWHLRYKLDELTPREREAVRLNVRQRAEVVAAEVTFDGTLLVRTCINTSSVSRLLKEHRRLDVSIQQAINHKVGAARPFTAWITPV